MLGAPCSERWKILTHQHLPIAQWSRSQGEWDLWGLPISCQLRFVSYFWFILFYLIFSPGSPWTLHEANNNLEAVLLLLPPSQCWHDTCAQPCPGYTVLGILPRASWRLGSHLPVEAHPLPCLLASKSGSLVPRKRNLTYTHTLGVTGQTRCAWTLRLCTAQLHGWIYVHGFPCAEHVKFYNMTALAHI